MNIKELGWKVLAHIVSKPLIANAIIKRSRKIPYSPIISRDGDELYMDRHWVFNPYGKTEDGRTAPPKWPWLPSIRVHHICLPDDDDHEHDHPWDARTIILKGWYQEERRNAGFPKRLMVPGDTAPIKAGDFHRIDMVSDDGAYTLFFTWKYMEDWGFLVNNVKIPWRTYLYGIEIKQPDNSAPASMENTTNG